jgi:hypothetical protein
MSLIPTSQGQITLDSFEENMNIGTNFCGLDPIAMPDKARDCYLKRNGTNENEFDVEKICHCLRVNYWPLRDAIPTKQKRYNSFSKNTNVK